MTPARLHAITTLALERAGLSPARLSPEHVAARLGVVAREHGLAGLDALFARLDADRDDALVWRAVEALAPGRCGFFRDVEAFQALRAAVIPRLERFRGGAGPLRVWSAGCGAGQEAYSLAMIFADRGWTPGAGGAQILASDLSVRALAQAEEGAYAQSDVQTGLPVSRLITWFRKVDDRWRVREDIKTLVAFRRINLLEPPPEAGPFDLILCRYVLADLAGPARGRVVRGLLARLAPGGVLMLGLGEPAPAGTPGLRRLPEAPGAFMVQPIVAEPA